MVFSLWFWEAITGWRKIGQIIRKKQRLQLFVKWQGLYLWYWYSGSRLPQRVNLGSVTCQFLHDFGWPYMDPNLWLAYWWDFHYVNNKSCLVPSVCIYILLLGIQKSNWCTPNLPLADSTARVPCIKDKIHTNRPHQGSTLNANHEISILFSRSSFPLIYIWYFYRLNLLGCLYKLLKSW